MDKKKLIESLSPIEKQALSFLKEDFNSVDSLANEEIDKTTLLRAVALLEKKKLVEVKSETKKIIDLGVFGIQYNKTELPERKLLDLLFQKKSIEIRKIQKECKISDNEAKVSVGTLKKKALIDIDNGLIKLSPYATDAKKKFLEEMILETLPREEDSLKPEEKLAVENLKKRKEIIEIKEQKITYAKLTKEATYISEEELKEQYLEQLDSKMLKGNSWKNKKFRRYDLSAPAPRIYGGKKHFVNQSIEHAKKIWLEMGFKEMEGNKVETGFWAFDSLFTAQDHPVREMQDTFFIKDLKGKLPKQELVDEVKKAHEGGVDESLGWNYIWGEEDAKKVLLRTHTTALSIHKLLEIAKNKEFPAKYFAIGKCFRNETVDWSHGFEFYQTEGIVIDENANFRQLLGYLLQFYKKMGYEKVRVRPGYFAYTEPSLEIDVFHPVKKEWIELGGAGMFRPEVTIPIFGKHIPVLAWGQGLGRIITQFYKINDLREMYKNNITQLRDMKFWNPEN